MVEARRVTGFGQLFGGFDCGLFWLLPELLDGQELVVEVENDLLIRIQDGRDLSTLQGISGPSGFDLIDDPIELDLEVLGDDPGVMAGENAIEVNSGIKGDMSIVR